MTLAEMFAHLAELRSELEDENVPAERINEIREERASLENQISAEQARIEARNAEIDAITRLPQSRVITPRNEELAAGTSAEGSEDPFGTMEYRRAFMAYVMRGTPMPVELRTDTTTTSTNAGVAIPTPVLQQVIEKLEKTGKIYALVTKTAFPGGLRVPTSTAKPVATWVSEGSGSDKQKKELSYISFGYYKLRCAVSVTLETDVMSLAFFETTISNNILEAMMKKIEEGIVKGSGSGQPTGIVNTTIITGHNVDITKAGSPALADLESAMTLVPEAYEDGLYWFMSKSMFFKYFGLKDTAGQPIARINYGLAGAPERILLGIPVICTEHMPTYAAAPTADTVMAFLVQPSDYILNTNLQIRVKRYEDDDTDDMVTKAIMLLDGKLVDNNSLVTITKKSA